MVNAFVSVGWSCLLVGTLVAILEVCDDASRDITDMVGTVFKSFGLRGLDFGTTAC